MWWTTTTRPAAPDRELEAKVNQLETENAQLRYRLACIQKVVEETAAIGKEE